MLLMCPNQTHRPSNLEDMKISLLNVKMTDKYCIKNGNHSEDTPKWSDIGNIRKHLGMLSLPLTNITAVIPAVITRKTTASATARADVYLNESAFIWKKPSALHNKEVCAIDFLLI